MKVIDLGVQLLREDWYIAELRGEQFILFAKGEDLALYDCNRDIIIERSKAKETWDPKQKPKIVTEQSVEKTLV